MRLVLLTALGVGGATVFGALIGFCFKRLSHKFSDIVLSFAAGVMLAAAVLGLILPSLEYGGNYGLLITVAGMVIEVSEEHHSKALSSIVVM
jgi:ZIP family zinc transporter